VAKKPRTREKTSPENTNKMFFVILLTILGIVRP